MDYLKEANEILNEEGLKNLFFQTLNHLHWRVRREFWKNYYIVKHRVTRKEIVSINGIKINLAHDRISAQMANTIRTRDFETSEAKLLKAHLSPIYPFIELGSGVGYISSLADEILNDSTISVAIEADETLVPILEDTRDMNSADFFIYNRAYHPNNNEIKFRASKNFWSSSSFDRGHSNGTETTVPATNIQGVIERHDIEDPIQLLVDIEGGEFNLVSDEIEQLKSHCRLLIVETHHFVEENPETLHCRLRDNGFIHIGKEENVFAYENSGKYEK